MALEAIGGDGSTPTRSSFDEALSAVEFDAPNGHIKLDENRQAIGSVFIDEVREREGTARST